MNRLPIIAILVLVPSLVHAQGAAQAETLFRQGKELMAQGKLAEACAAFDAGQKLDPTITGLLIQANCHEKNNQFATAWGLFLEAERQTRAATDDESKQFHETASLHASRLEPRLSTLTIKINDDNHVGGLEILNEGVPVDKGAWNKALPIDGGTYKISARAPGNPEWSSTVTVGAEHDAKTLEIPKLNAAVLDKGQLNGVHKDEPEPGPTRHRELGVVPLALGGAGIVLLGGALGFDLWGDSTYNQAKVEPNDAKQKSLWDSANTKRYVAEGMVVGGLACAGVAVWYYLRGVEEPPRARVILEPSLASNGAGLQIAGWF